MSNSGLESYLAAVAQSAEATHLAARGSNDEALDLLRSLDPERTNVGMLVVASTLLRLVAQQLDVTVDDLIAQCGSAWMINVEEVL